MECYDIQKHECDGRCQSASSCPIAQAYHQGKEYPTKEEMKQYINDATEQFKKLDKNKIAEHIEKYYIQPDVLDYHVVRVFSGESYDEDKPEGITVEHNKVDMDDIYEILKGCPALSRRSKDAFLDTVKKEKLIRTIVEKDLEDGLENYNYEVFDTMEEVMRFITEDVYAIVS